MASNGRLPQLTATLPQDSFIWQCYLSNGTYTKRVIYLFTINLGQTQGIREQYARRNSL